MADDYWPETAAPQEDPLGRSVAQFRRDLQAMQDLVAYRSTDLYAKLPGKGQTISREALLVADQQRLHIGQIVSLRQELGVLAAAGAP